MYFFSDQPQVLAEADEQQLEKQVRACCVLRVRVGAISVKAARLAGRRSAN